MFDSRIFKCRNCRHPVSKPIATTLHIDFGGRLSTDCKACAEEGKKCYAPEISQQ